LVFAVALTGQSSSAPAAPPASPSTTQAVPEISSRDETPTFKVKVNLVEVRVVVRDAKGNAIGNLKQEDFQLLDNGKPQVISKFSVEKLGDTPVIQEEKTPDSAATTIGPAPAPATTVPRRYIAYLFDDVHLQFLDLAQARNAAIQQLQSLTAADRAAIYTTSGQTQLDFTDDRAQLIATLNRILPRPIANTGVTPCPNLSYYLADAIANQHDQQAERVGIQDAVDCGAIAQSGGNVSAAVQIQSYARQELEAAGQETLIALRTLGDVVRRVAAAPGQRIIVLVSPGFMNVDELALQSEVAERAVHLGIVINTLDARGLYTNMPDASEQRSPSSSIAGQMLQYHSLEQSADATVMADLADTTGGIFFHNNNDLAEGFRRLAGAPEYSYLLGFSPQGLKPDGHYHKLKVTLKSPAQGAVQARKGYYAPKAAADPSEQAKEAIQEAVFSQEELREIPVELHTQFFKPDENDAKLSVLARMDVRHLQFRKNDGRNNDDVTVVSAVFDRNGNFVNGTEKVVQMHLTDETLRGGLSSGITLKSSFDLKPGSYLVRLVVRDAVGQMAAQSSAVTIP
jgi:VWFA-related protein